MKIAVNNYDFPTGSLPSTDEYDRPATYDTHASLLGIYASAAGNLVTHANEVKPGYTVAQIATSIARPGRGYANNFNFFDPDNYFALTALAWSNDPYLQDQAKKIVMRSGDFLLDSGQLPHHFIGVKPTYTAISGAIQSG